MDSQPRNRDKKILDEVREVMRLHHYSIHTERSCRDSIKRYAAFHNMQSRADLSDAETKINAFLYSGPRFLDHVVR